MPSHADQAHPSNAGLSLQSKSAKSYAACLWSVTPDGARPRLSIVTALCTDARMLLLQKLEAQLLVPI